MPLGGTEDEAAKKIASVEEECGEDIELVASALKKILSEILF